MQRKFALCVFVYMGRAVFYRVLKTQSKFECNVFNYKYTQVITFFRDFMFKLTRTDFLKKLNFNHNYKQQS